MNRIEYYRGAMLTMHGDIITSVTVKNANGDTIVCNAIMELANNWCKNKSLYQILDSLIAISRGNND